MQNSTFLNIIIQQNLLNINNYIGKVNYQIIIEYFCFNIIYLSNKELLKYLYNFEFKLVKSTRDIDINIANFYYFKYLYRKLKIL